MILVMQQTKNREYAAEYNTTYTLFKCNAWDTMIRV